MIEYSNEMKPDWSKANGLLPCVVQDYDSARVLMLGFVNADSIEQSIKTGKLCFFSRSRQKLWMKGETSGNFLILKRLFIDCDNDSFLAQVKPIGPTCHRNTTSCFDSSEKTIPAGTMDFLSQLQKIISERKLSMIEGSYTTSLFESGLARIAQKVGEEGVETALAGALQQDNLVDEASDLIYHLMVLLEARDKSIEDVVKRLQERHSK